MVEIESLLDIWIDLKEIITSKTSNGNYEYVIDCEKLFPKFYLNPHEKILLYPNQSKICIRRKYGSYVSSTIRIELISSTENIVKVELTIGEKCYISRRQYTIYASDRMKIITNEDIEDCSINIDANKTVVEII